MKEGDNEGGKKTKQTQNVAQTPSAVVIQSSPKGCPDFCLLPFTFLLVVKTNPIIQLFMAKR